MNDDEILANAEMMVEALGVTESNLLFWIEDLQDRHDRVAEEMKHPDEYQEGYLHGVSQSIEYLKSAFPILEQRRQWAKELCDDVRHRKTDE